MCLMGNLILKNHNNFNRADYCKVSLYKLLATHLVTNYKAQLLQPKFADSCNGQCGHFQWPRLFMD